MMEDWLQMFGPYRTLLSSHGRQRQTLDMENPV